MNVLVAGCGAISRRWLRVLAADPRVTITALADTDLNRARHAATEHRLTAAGLTDSITHALDVYAPDIVVNLTPPQHHYGASMLALISGTHVLSEKPLTLTLAEAIELAAVAQDRKLVLTVMSNRAQDRGFNAFARLAPTGVPLAVSADVMVELGDPGFRTAQATPVAVDLAVHAFDQIQLLVSAPPMHVTASETPLPFLSPHASLANLMVRFADGSVFSYRGGFTGPGLRTPSAGLWRVDGPGRQNMRWDATPTPDSAAAVPSYAACITAMIDTIAARDSQPWPVSTLRSIAMLEAAVASISSGSPMAVMTVPLERP